MLALPTAAIPTWTAATLLCGCGPEQKRYVPNAGDGMTTPTMSTSDVSTLISDSGYTRYHLTSPLWLMFEDAEEPFRRFPDGLELQQYDLEMQTVGQRGVRFSNLFFSQTPMGTEWQRGHGKYRSRFIPDTAAIPGPGTPARYTLIRLSTLCAPTA